MAKIDRMMVGESLVGEGNEVAHIDLIIGPRGSPVESAFANALTNNKDGFTTLLAVVAPNLPCKPDTLMFNKVTIKGQGKGGGSGQQPGGDQPGQQARDNEASPGKQDGKQQFFHDTDHIYII